MLRSIWQFFFPPAPPSSPPPQKRPKKYPRSTDVQDFRRPKNAADNYTSKGQNIQPGYYPPQNFHQAQHPLHNQQNKGLYYPGTDTSQMSAL